MCLCLGTRGAYALPEGGVVSGGSATIQDAGAHTVVFQGSDRAVVDWGSFDVGAGEEVHFSQPSSSSAILNRIHDTDASRIDGALTANGQVYLVNPNGMVFGSGSQVDVGSLVASTADISNAAFMKGGILDFTLAGNPNASIINAGDITAREGGLVALVAPNVANSGIITAKAGTVALAAGDTMTLDFYGDDLLSVAVSDAVQKETVTNNGEIYASGGTVLMTTAEAASVIDRAINMNGVVDASSATSEGGTIVFAGQDANITVQTGAILNATGATGGGTVLIGGEYQGKGETPTAKNTTIEKGASIDASATQTGNGGEVIVWADTTTIFAGDIKAKGGAGAQGGSAGARPSLEPRAIGAPAGAHGAQTNNGGFVETSGKDKLYATGNVDASAPHGAAGQWLLDPTNVTIANGAGTDVSVGGTYNGVATIDATTIQTALNGGTSVTITTTSGGADAGDITVTNATINKTLGGPATLTLKADNSILTAGVNSITSSSGALNTILWADADNSGFGAINLTNTAITTNGGNFVAAGGLDDGANGGTAADGIPDNFARGTAANDDGIEFSNGDVSTGAGSLTLRGRGQDNAGVNLQAGINIIGGSVLQSTTGNISITGIAGAGAGFNRGVYLLDAGTLVTSVDGNISITGNGGSNGLAGSVDNHGILVNGANITSTGTGAANITLNGTGGAGGTGNLGIYIVTGTLITAVDGNISITGNGGSNGLAVGITSNYGIYVNGANITSTGTGTGAANITLNGTGGVGGGNNNHGISIVTGTLITAVDGDISITGNGSSNGLAGSNGNYGIYVGDNADITSTGIGTGAANITLNGTGGAGDNGNVGVYLLDAGTLVTAVDGNISITGQGAGAGVNNHGILLVTDPDILSTGDGNITLTGTAGTGGVDFITGGGTIDIGGAAATGNITLSMNNYSFANTTFSTTGSITIQPRSVNTSVGVAGGAGALDVSAALLSLMNAGNELIIGRADGDGVMTVNPYALWSTRAGTGVKFLSDDGAITLTAGVHAFGARNLTLETDADPTITGTVTGTGILTAMPSSAAQTMGVAGGGGVTNLSGADIVNLGTGWSSVQLGRTDGVGALTQDAYSWFSPVIWRAATGGAITVSGAQTADVASDTNFTFSGPTTLLNTIDASAATGGTRAIAFNGATTLGVNTTIAAGAGNVTFGSTLNGAQTLGVTTTGNITFTGAAGGVTPLGNVTMTGATNIAATGGLTSSGNINATATTAITGSYTGTNGVLNSGAGTITATTSFNTLNILGAGATLSAGYIGAAGPASQNMANLISIAGIAYPNLTPSPAYTYAGFVIGQANPSGGGAMPPVTTTTTTITPDPTPAPSPVEPGSVGDPLPIVGNTPSITSIGGGAMGLPSAYTHPAADLSNFVTVADGTEFSSMDTEVDNVDVQYQEHKGDRDSNLVEGRNYILDPHLRAWLSEH